MTRLHFVSSAKIMSNKTATVSFSIEESEPSRADLSAVAAASAAVAFHRQQDDRDEQNRRAEEQGEDKVEPEGVLRAGH